MRRAYVHGTSALADPPGQESSGEPTRGLRTEFAFVLPRGYVDSSTARDELVSQRDDRVRENPNYLAVVLISRVVSSLGDIEDVHGGIIENLFASDLAFLQDLYRRINQDGHTHARVTCPNCNNEFAVDVAGSRLGES